MPFSVFGRMRKDETKIYAAMPRPPTLSAQHSDLTLDLVDSYHGATQQMEIKSAVWKYFNVSD